MEHSVPATLFIAEIAKNGFKKDLKPQYIQMIWSQGFSLSYQSAFKTNSSIRPGV